MAAQKNQRLNAFQYPNFLWVWCVQAISQVESASHAVAISFYMKETFQSGAIVETVVFFRIFRYVMPSASRGISRSSQQPIDNSHQ